MEPWPLPAASALFDDAPCGLLITSEDGQILRCNRLFSQWLGFSQAQLCGRRFQQVLIAQQTADTPWAALGTVPRQLTLRQRDGRSLNLLVTAVHHEHAGRALRQLALIGVPDSVEPTHRDLDRADETAQQRALFAEQLVAIASHDLKNPLTAICMATEMLVRGQHTAKEQQLLEHIRQSARRAQRLIADLLDFALARGDHGLSLHCRTLDLHQMVAQSISELRVAFPQAILLHHTRGVGTVSLDADRLQQVIGNLVANGVAYGDQLRPVTILSALDGETLTVSVHNEGPVIPASVLAVLFAPMIRASHRADTCGSVGLGLFIVSEIAKAHGGHAHVSSTADSGTTFSVHWPIRQPILSAPAS